MNHLKELSPGTIRPDLLEAIERDVIEDIRLYARSRATNVMWGAETPELAAVLIDKYCQGMASALYIVGLDSVVRVVGDRLVREMDPQFEAHLLARQAARPASLNFVP